MSKLSAIAVFCGSSPGFDEIFLKTATNVGSAVAEAGCSLVYGGAKVGLMGAVADGALNAGGRVTGILPAFLQTKEIAHTGLTELLVVQTMHERKLLMHERSDAIIALPGGWGTMEELMEMLTWAQLGLHQKPIGLLNVGGFYNGLLLLVDEMQRSGFLKPEHAGMLLVEEDIHSLLRAMTAYNAPDTPKWLTEERT